MEKNEMLEVEVSSREELLEELKGVYQEIDVATAKGYQRKWKQFDSWESAYDEELNDSFYGMIDFAYAKVKDEQKKNEEIKRELIAQANVQLSSKNMGQATKTMNELMTTWKETKSAGRDLDEELWQEFNKVRQSFYDLKSENYKQLQEKFVHSKAVKEALIQEVETLKDSTDYKKTSTRMNELMKAWKEAGSSGREFDDALWNTFNDLRQVFYDNKAKHYAGLEEQYAQNNKLKKELIEKVREVAEEEYYNRENTEKMKAFSAEWKTIGFSGKEYDNANWVQFKSLTDQYFAELKAFNENRAQMYQQRMKDRKANIQSDIERERRAIERLKNEIAATISERGVAVLEEEIEDCKAYIQELEAELNSLD